MKGIKYLIYILICTFAKIQFSSASENPYTQIIDMYDRATVLSSFPENVGAYVGRCYDFRNPKLPAGSLLAIQEKITGDNGPSFPITSEKKAVTLYSPESTYYDDYPVYDRSLREQVDQYWGLFTELEFLTNEWMTSSSEFNRIISIRKLNDQILTLETVEDTSKLPSDLLKEFKRLSYKRVFSSCYYFKKLGQ